MGIVWAVGIGVCLDRRLRGVWGVMGWGLGGMDGSEGIYVFRLYVLMLVFYLERFLGWGKGCRWEDGKQARTHARICHDGE